MPEARPTRAGSLIQFFLLTFVVTWSCFLAYPMLDASPGAARLFARPVLLFGVFAPSLVAVGLTARAGGGAAVRSLLGRILEWRVSAGWYAFAIGYLAAIKLTVAVVLRITAGAWPRFGAEEWYILLAATLLSTPAQAGEEVGWRGYALPHMAARMGLPRASVLLGVIWALWHLPLFFVPGADTHGQSFAVYLLQVTALSVAMAWLYAHTRASLLLVMLMHAAVNNTKDLVPSAMEAASSPFVLTASPVAWLTVALLWACAAWFLARMPKLDLPRF